MEDIDNIKSYLESDDFKKGLQTFMAEGAYFTKKGNYNTLTDFVPEDKKEKTFGFSFPNKFDKYKWDENDFGKAIELFVSLLQENKELTDYIKNICNGNIENYSNGADIFRVIANKFEIKKGTYTNNKGTQQTQSWSQAISTALCEDSTLKFPAAGKEPPKHCASYYNSALNVANNIHKSEVIDESLKKVVNTFLLNTYVGLCFILNKIEIKDATPKSPASSNSSSNSNTSEGSRAEQDNKAEIPIEDKQTQKGTTVQDSTNAADVNGKNQKEDNAKSPNDDKEVGSKSVEANGKDGTSISKQNSKQKKSSNSSKGNNKKTPIGSLQLKCVDTSNRTMKKARNTYYQLCFLEFKRFVKSTAFTKGNDYGFLSAFCYCLIPKDPNIQKGFKLSHINFSEEEYKEAIDFFFYLYSGKSSDSGAINHIKGLLAFCIPGGMAEKNKQTVKDLELHGEKFTQKIATEFGISPSVSGNSPKWEEWIEAIKVHLAGCFEYPCGGVKGDASDFCRALQVDKKIRNENAHEWKGANIAPSDWPATLKFLLHSYIGLCLILIKVARTENRNLPPALKNDQNKFEEFRKTDIFITTPNQLISSLSINEVNLNIANNNKQHTVSLSPQKYKIKWIFDDNNPYEEEVTIPEYFDVSIIITGDNVKVTYDSALTEYITGHLGDNNLGGNVPKSEGAPEYHIHISGGNIGGISFGGDNTGNKVSGENTENTNSPATPTTTSTGSPEKEPSSLANPHRAEQTKKGDSSNGSSSKWVFLLLVVIIIMGAYFLLGKGPSVEQNVTVITGTEQVAEPKTGDGKPGDGPNATERPGNPGAQPGRGSGGTTPPPVQPPTPNPQPKVDANYEAGMAAYNAGEGLEAIKKFQASGSADANYMLGIIYENGCGSIAANQMKARDYYKKAKNLGSEKAKAKL